MDVWAKMEEGGPTVYEVRSDDALLAHLLHEVYSRNGLKYGAGYGKVSHDGKVLSADCPLSTIKSTFPNPIIVSPPPPPPPPLPPLPPPSLGDKYVEREFANRKKVIDQMENRIIAFIGPKGAGKSTTLAETYYEAVKLGKQCLYIDLLVTEDVPYKGTNCAGYYVFIDNAQRFRKDKFVHIPAMLHTFTAKVCLAYSPVLVSDEGGYAHLKSPVQQHAILIEFMPFTSTELDLYLRDYPGVTYNRETTLPIVVRNYLAGERNDEAYEKIARSMITQTIGSIVSRLNSASSSAATDLLTSLYTFCLSYKGVDMQQLVYSGIVYYVSQAQEYRLVFDRKLLFQKLTSTARNQFKLFSQFDIGAADQFLFVQVCMRGRISLKCLGDRALSIKGRKDQPREIELTCSRYTTQTSIGSTVDAPERECTLIKLAQNHPAVDFLIVDKSRGGVSARALYFIQVTNSRYQDRPADKKFDAVKCPFNGLSDTPYEVYYKMFKIRNHNAYYVFSSASIPSDKNFTENRIDQTRVYFHSLMLYF